MPRALAGGALGPEAFTLFLRLLNKRFESNDTGASYIKMHNSGVSNGTLFCDFSRAFRGVCRPRRGLSVFWNRGWRLFWRLFG